MKKVVDFFIELLKTVILALVIVLPIRIFLFQPFIVKGQSMEPAFENGDYLIVDELTYRFKNPQRGEIIVFKLPQGQRLIKRIIGLPGETVEIKEGQIKIINSKGEFLLDEKKYLQQEGSFGDLRISLNEDEYFVLGDNRAHSLDSRIFGPIKKEQIIGRVIIRLWPLNSISLFLKPVF
jgi:signal peptidase I